MTLCNIIDINCLDCPYKELDDYFCLCCYSDKQDAIREFEEKISHYQEILNEIKRSEK